MTANTNRKKPTKSQHGIFEAYSNLPDLTGKVKIANTSLQAGGKHSSDPLGLKSKSTYQIQQLINFEYSYKSL